MADQALTPAQVADFVAVWQAWGNSVDQFNAWMMGTATGGPNGDGRYPLTNRGGQVVLVMCPAKLATLVPTGQPFDWLFDCYSPREMVRVATGLSPLRAPRVLILSEIRASVIVADMSSAQTYGIRINVRVAGTSILSAPLRILPGQLSSKADGTPQPTISTPRIPDDALVSIDVEAEGSGARGLVVYLKGNYE
ncbi:hypothetical protein [Sphingomonas sp. Marseille-Q8236]